MNRETPTFSKYRVVAKLDHGGMADVYLCLTKGPAGFNKLHVVKQLRRELATGEASIAMFLDEARLAARLNHPNVVQTNEIGESDSGYFLAMEYLEGQALSKVLRAHAAKKGEPLPSDVHLRILCDAMSGLHYAHELRDFDGQPIGIVHRDVSPQNVFVAYTGNVKLLDFGIAKASVSTSHTAVGVIKGKLRYMSPEQITSGTIDRRSDVFSMGIMLWNAVVGKSLFHGESDVEHVRRVCSGTIPSPREIDPNVPEELDRICTRALSFSPADRYPTIAELRLDVETYLAKLGTRVSSDEVGKLVEELFGEDRKRISRVIEEQIRRIDAEPDASHAPVSLTLSAATGSGSLAPSTGSGSLAPSNPRPTAHALAMTLGSEAPGPAPGRSRARLVGLSLALMALAAVGVTQVMPKSAATLPPAAAVAPRADDIVIVDVRVTPREALLYLDGAPLDGNPYVARRTRSLEAHSLRIELPDGTSETRPVTFDKDLHLELTLARTDHASPALAQRATAPKTASPAPPPRAVAAAGTSALTPATPLATAAPTASAAPQAGSKATKSKPQLDKIDL